MSTNNAFHFRPLLGLPFRISQHASPLRPSLSFPKSSKTVVNSDSSRQRHPFPPTGQQLLIVLNATGSCPKEGTYRTQLPQSRLIPHPPPPSGKSIFRPNLARVHAR
ncbi:hypothetical protein TNCV_633871 [Trichonephila clavipes]|nr:hypothetical protein TNCV_633871 [Trichonephila clavipes]